jgi:hypothetical protein
VKHPPAHITFFIFSNGNFLLRGLIDDMALNIGSFCLDKKIGRDA